MACALLARRRQTLTSEGSDAQGASSKEDAASLQHLCRGLLDACAGCLWCCAECHMQGRLPSFCIEVQAPALQTSHIHTMMLVSIALFLIIFRLTVCMCVCVLRCMAATAAEQADQEWYELHQLLRCAAVCHGQS
jgi:hypothetical protein